MMSAQVLKKVNRRVLPDSKTNPREKYSLLEKIGQGGFGYVYKALDMQTGQIVAAKLINLEEAGDELETVQQEVAVMSNCNCNQLTKYYASYLNGR
jgi:serine/threonine protein kinase